MAEENTARRVVRFHLEKSFEGDMKKMSLHAGKNDGWVADIMNPKRTKGGPSISNLELLATSMGLSLSEFFDIEDGTAAHSPSNRALLVEKSAREVLVALNAGQIIKSMSIPVEQAAALIRGVWQRRSLRPETTNRQIHLHLADELDLLSGGQGNSKAKIIEVLEQEAPGATPEPPCKPH